MIVIVDSGGANLISIQSAFASLGQEVLVSSSKQDIEKASHLILPGVGSAKSIMERLNALDLVEVLQKTTKPLLGICVGMQILFDFSEEGSTNCLGILKGVVKKLQPDESLSLPHMGWNQITICSPSGFFKDITQNAYVYYVHSFAAPISSHTIAETRYGSSFTAVAAYKNFLGVQFHPERSGLIGKLLLKNFLEQKL